MKRKGIITIIIFLFFLAMITLNNPDTNLQMTNENLNLTSSHTIDSDWTTNWTYSEPSGTDVSVVPSFDGQSSVLFLDDDSTDINGFCAATHSFGVDKTSGRIDIYFQVSRNDFIFQFVLQKDGSDSEKIGLRITNKFGVYYSGSWQDLDINTFYIADTWYEVGFEFNCTTQQMKVYINGELKSTDPFQGSDSHVDAVKIQTGIPSAGAHTSDDYLAWMDYSWVTPASTTPPPFPIIELVIILECVIGGIAAASIGAFLLIKRKRAMQESVVL